MVRVLFIILMQKKNVYSVYEDYTKYINSQKIIDLTIPSFGKSSPKFENLVEDLKIIAKHKNICFGTSGAFSITRCISNDVISYSLNDKLSNFFDPNRRIIKVNEDQFISDLKNFIK